VPESHYKPRNEVRFAVVMYGGVSLAIYINGVAQELFRLVRSTAPNADKSGLAVGDSDLTAIEAVYREIGRRRVGDTFWNPLDAAGLGEGVETRFVVDILSGTSAGGINGILLAKALANGLEGIDGLKDLWINEGDIADLLNKRSAFKDIPPFSFKKPPSSLLAGDRLFAKARKAIEEMGERDATAPHYADQVDLAVTMTDLQGAWLPIRLADGTVSEPRHRAALRFTYGDGLNQFAGAYDRMLAFAARATSSFPFAFAPIVLEDVNSEPADEEKRLFNDWIQIGAEYQRFAFADGGYLYNKPFSHATRALARRAADRPVTRKLLYVEPDPNVVPRDRNEAKERPDAVANAGLAMVGLPSAQPIRDDLEDIQERNAALDRIEAATRELLVEVVRPSDPPPMSSASATVYLRLRRASVVESLGQIVERAVSLRPGGDWAELARLLIEAQAGGGDSAIPAYLAPLDLEFRLRRLSYIEALLDQIAGGGRAAQDLISATELKTFNSGNAMEQVVRCKSYVSHRREALISAARGMRARGVDDSTILEESAEVANLCHTYLEAVTHAADPAQDVAEIYARPDVMEALDGFVEAVAGELRETFDEDRATDFATVDGDGDLEQALAEMLNRAFARAETLDHAIYPLRWPALGEARKVDVHRVSPRDSESLVSMPDLGDNGKPTGPLRLAGVSLGHFGGFLDQAWRRNDMLWGRLDAAERLIAILVPHEDARDSLRVRAHAAILREEFDGDPYGDLLDLLDPVTHGEFGRLLKGDDDVGLVGAFADAYTGPLPLDRAKASRLGASSMSVGGGVLGGIKPGPVRVLLMPVALLLRGIGRVASGALGLVDGVKRLFRRR
jgi:predicted acylesterase/phospholipase RssA